MIRIRLERKQSNRNRIRLNSSINGVKGFNFENAVNADRRDWDGVHKLKYLCSRGQGTSCVCRCSLSCRSLSTLPVIFSFLPIDSNN